MSAQGMSVRVGSLNKAARALRCLLFTWKWYYFVVTSQEGESRPCEAIEGNYCCIKCKDLLL